MIERTVTILKASAILALLCASVIPLYPQTTVSLAPQTEFYGTDANGKPLSGGQVFTYAAGTTTPLASYTDWTGTVQNSNPVILNSAGRASIWLAQSAYKIVVEDASGVVQWSQDNVVGGGAFTPAPPVYFNVMTYGAKGDGVHDDTAAIQACITAAAAAASHAVIMPGGTYLISAPITIPSTFRGGTIKGVGNTTELLASPSFTGATMLSGSSALDRVWVDSFTVNANNVASITKVVDFSGPEPLGNVYVHRLNIVSVPVGSIGLDMDGEEDSTIEDTIILTDTTFAANTYALTWRVPGGNIHIWGSVWNLPMILQYQSASVTGSTIGPVVVDGAADSLVLTDCYIYSGIVVNTTYGNFYAAAPNFFGNIEMNGCYLHPHPGTGTVAAFIGNYGATVVLNGTTIDKTFTASSYSLLSSDTLAIPGAKPSFQINGASFLEGATVGTPAANVYVYSHVYGSDGSYVTAYFPTGVTTLGPLFNVPYPSVVTRLTAIAAVGPVGCTTSAVAEVVGQPSTHVTLANGQSQWDTGAIAVPIPAGLQNVQITTSSSGCSTAPTGIQVVAQIQPQ